MLGEKLGRYRLLSELGTGGMGTVYLAEDDRGSRRALKIVHPHLELTPRFRERFLREAAIGKRIRHPNVVATYDVDTLDFNGRAALFLAMEYVEGQTLRALLEELGRAPEELCLHIAMEIAKALEAIHAAGVVHRDLKPENVLITKDHHVVKVMDLGVARVLDETVGLSQTGSFIGSVLYGAPEQFGSDSPDGRTDLYALGLLLYELSTGIHPFAGSDVATVIQRLLTEAPRPPAQRNPELTLFFSEVTRNLLSKDRDERIATAGRLRETLQAGEQSDWWQRRATGVRKSNVVAPRRVRIPRETALFGRDEQLATMRALFDRAKAGEGQTLLIEGETGIGKTRLIDEFVGRLRDEGEELHFLFGRFPPGGAATAASAFVAAVRDHFGVEGIEKTLCTRLEVSPTLVPSFSALLRGDAAPSVEAPLSKESIQAVFVDVLRALAGERPTILLIDDLHFAPDGGRALFAALSLAVPGHRLMLAGTSGLGVADDWLSGLDLTRLALSRLGPKDLAHVLTDAFSSEGLARELAFQIGAKSDGNPFFVFEIIQGLRDGRYLTRREDGAWEKAQVIDEIRIPDTVKDLIRGRVASLDQAGRDLLEVAACCGQKFDPRLVGEVLGLDPIPVLQQLGRIEKRHHLVRFAGPVCMFDHHQVQEVLYHGLSAPLREEYHAALAEALELRGHTDDRAGPDAVALCRHFLLAGRESRTKPYLSTALDHLENSHSNSAVIDLARRVLAVDGLFDGRARAELLLRLRARLDLLGRREEEREVLHEALGVADETGDPGLQARACHEFGQHYFRVASYEEAGAFFRQALALADEASDLRMAARATRCLGSIAFQRGEFEEARRYLRRARAMARVAGDKGSEAKAHGNLGIALLNLGRPVQARRHLLKHLALSREVGDRQGEVTATVNLGLVSSGQGDMEEARRNFEQGLALSREMGFRQGEASATGNLGSVYHSLGRFAEARERFDSHHALCHETGDRKGETVATGNLGMVSLSLGCYAEAYTQLAAFCIGSREIGDMRGEALALEAMGRLQIGLGDPVAARDSLTAALALARAIGARGPEGDVLHSLGLLAENGDDTKEARRRYDQALALRRATAKRGGEAATLAALGRLLDDPERLDAALSLAREVGAAGTALVAGAHLARLRGSVEILANEAQAEHAERMEARYALWRATNQRSHLEAARRLLRELLERAPEHCVDAMRHNVRLHRAVLSRA